MKIPYRTVKVLVASITVALAIVAGPVFAHTVLGSIFIHNGESHRHEQLLSQMPNDTVSTSMKAFYDHRDIHPSDHHYSASDRMKHNPPFKIKVSTQRATVRKNVVDLTLEEKKAFINAVVKIKHKFTEGSQLSIYDQFVADHVGTMGMMLPSAIGPAAGYDAAHESALFLPWHREYLDRFERALQSVNPKVTVPYWDWTDPKALDVIFQDDFLGPNGKGTIIDLQGLGSFEGGAVQSGYFSEANGWKLIEDLHIKPSTNETLGTSLLRFLKLPPGDKYPISPQEVNQVLLIDDYNLFRPALEGFATDERGLLLFTEHNYVHGVVGGAIFDPVTGIPSALGTMSNILSSANDPVFWLVHSNVDRLWAEWQVNGHEGSDFYPATDQPFGKNLKDPMWPWDGGLSKPGNLGPGDFLSLLTHYAPDDIVKPIDTLDIKKYGYTYDTLETSASEATLK